MKSIYTLLLAAASFVIAYLLLGDMPGFGGLFLRSAVFAVLYGGSIVFFKLSPDLKPVVATVVNRLRPKRP